MSGSEATVVLWLSGNLGTLSTNTGPSTKQRQELGIDVRS